MGIVERLRERSRQYVNNQYNFDALAADEIERLRSVLHECYDFVDKYADVVDGDDGELEPNEALSLLALINHALDGKS